jgi:hypothetical protein
MPSIAQILRHGQGAAMSHALGIALAVAALGLGYASHGWQGVVLALTVVVFWLLLQFSRALRVLRAAGSRPVGTVPNAVMLQARLQRGMRLQAVLRLTGSLGRQVDGETDAFVWQDGAGDEVMVQLSGGKVQAWQLRRAEGAPQHPAA